MILAAGLGKRLRPLTDDIPKALVKFNGVPLLELLINKLIKHGFNYIVINIHYRGEKILEFLEQKHFPEAQIIISDEREKLLDTGGAIKKAAQYLDTPFLLHNVDIVSTVNLGELFSFHIRNNKLATLAVSNRLTDNVLVFDKNDNLCKWKSYKLNIQKPDINCLDEKEYAFSGIHVISPSIFKYFPSEDKFSIIDFYIQTALRGGQITFYDHSGAKWFDVGTIEKLNEAQKAFLKM